MKRNPSTGFSFTTGFVLGLFLTAIGGAFYLNSLNPQPEVKVVTVTKTKNVRVPVVVTKIVEKQVTRTEVRTEHKLYRAELVDENGNVTQSWEVTKCRFIVIGAQLTDKLGKTFNVTGQIKIEPIK